MRTLLSILRAVPVCLFASGVGAVVPERVTDIFNRQRPQIIKLLSSMDKSQYELLLDRYVDLMSESLLFADHKIDKDELRTLVRAQLPFSPRAEEAPTKKSKVHNAKADFSKHVELLINAFQGQTRGDEIVLHFVCGQKDYELPFVVINDPTGFALKMKGILIPDERADIGKEGNCLNMYFLQGYNKAMLTSLASKAVACPIPSEKGGSCLLEAAESISRVLSKDFLTVVDGSKLKCKDDKRSANLRRLKIYQGGQGWYEEHGFLSSVRPKTMKDEEAAFSKYPLWLLVKDVSMTQVGNPHREVFLAGARLFLEANKDATVGQYMSKLWKENCAAYIDIDMFLMESPLKLTQELYPRSIGFEKPLNR
jgi:hypothetical protein